MTSTYFGSYLRSTNLHFRIGFCHFQQVYPLCFLLLWLSAATSADSPYINSHKVFSMPLMQIFGIFLRGGAATTIDIPWYFPYFPISCHFIVPVFLVKSLYDMQFIHLCWVAPRFVAVEAYCRPWAAWTIASGSQPRRHWSWRRKGVPWRGFNVAQWLWWANPNTDEKPLFFSWYSDEFKWKKQYI